MSKTIKLLIMFFAVTILFLTVVMYQEINPSLSRIQVVEENEVGIYVSPDGKKRITVYFTEDYYSLTT